MSTSQTITITRALADLKTIDKRIEKQIDNTHFVSFQGQFHQPKVEVKNAPAQYQSITDLLKYRRKLKTLIVQSNANTVVRICGNDITVAEAIETKSSIRHFKRLLEQMKRQYANANQNVESINQRIRNDLEGKSNPNKQKEGENFDIVDFSKKYMEMHGVTLFDPLNVSKKIEDVDSYITNFENEVDYVLSEKNATTTITV